MPPAAAGVWGDAAAESRQEQLEGADVLLLFDRREDLKPGGVVLPLVRKGVAPDYPLPPLLLPPPSTLHTMSTAASASARISGLKRGFFGCKKFNSSSG